MSEIKIVFTGTPGAGKTTAINALSDVAPVSTDVEATDDLVMRKTHTTVALDFGELVLDGGTRLRLYGTPGQDRFDFMWRILIEGSLGVVIMINNTNPNPLEDLDRYLDGIGELITETPCIVAVTCTDLAARPGVSGYAERLQRRGLLLPVFAVDVRKREDVMLLMESLLSLIEMM